MTMFPGEFADPPVLGRWDITIRTPDGERPSWLELQHSGRDVVVSAPPEIPVIIFSGVPSESAELERLRPRTRLIEKPYSLVLLVETLEEMLADAGAGAGSQNLHS